MSKSKSHPDPILVFEERFGASTAVTSAMSGITGAGSVVGGAGIAIFKTLSCVFSVISFLSSGTVVPISPVCIHKTRISFISVFTNPIVSCTDCKCEYTRFILDSSSSTVAILEKIVGDMKTFLCLNCLLVIACLIPCICIVSYTDWYIDELPALVRNGLVNGDFPIWKRFVQVFTHDFWGNPLWEEERATHKSFRPIPTLIWRVIAYLQGGVFPSAFRLFACLSHACATFLIFPLGKQFGASRWPCLLGACLFACHPVHCENLAYIVGCADSLSTVFFALAILCWSHWYSILLCFASSLSKESGFVSFAVIFFMHCIHPMGNKKFLFGFATIFFPIARYVYVGGSPVNFAYADVPYIYETDWKIRGLSYLHVHSVYARLLLLPWNQSWDYSFDAVPLVQEIGDLRMLGSISAYLAVAALGSRLCTPTRIVPFAFFVSSFIPSSSLFIAVGTVVGERLLYPVSFGLALMVATTRKFPTLLLLLLPLYMWLFVGRISVWSSKLSLYETDATAWPRSCKTLHQYGAVLLNTKPRDLGVQTKVLSVLNESLTVFNDNALTDYLISQVYLEQGQISLAISVHEKIANGHGIGFTDFSRFMFLVDAGWALIANGNLSMYPIKIIEEGLEIFPYVAHAQNAVAIAYMSQGKMEEALAHLKFANEISHFENPIIWNNLGLWYERMGNSEAANECFEKSKDEKRELQLFYDRLT